jgi:sulfur carrier protein
MNLVLNGENRSLPGVRTVSELLEGLRLAINQVLVERNGQVVKREQFATTNLSENDRIEIVRVVAGG